MTTAPLLRALGLLALAGCAPAAPAKEPAALAPTPVAAPAAPAAPDHSGLRVSVIAPPRMPYDADSLGIGGRSVTIRLTNESAQPIRVRPLRVAFTAARGNVTFACREPPGRSSASEPGWLGPGQSFSFEEQLSCRLALPGPFDIQVIVRAGEVSAGRASAQGSAAFHVEVEGGARTPRPYPSREGLFVLMTGGKATQPLPPDAWARGDYSVLVAVINGGTAPLPVGRGKLSFLVYKLGSPLPCSGQSESLVLPDRLAPGAVHVVRAPVACAPSEEGSYDIVGRLTLGEEAEGQELEIGRIGLRVTRDPILMSPEPWLGTPQRPTGGILR